MILTKLWTIMAQFQTWFGNAPYLAYGIQLLPLTPIAEERDNVEWAKQLYTSYSESCQSTPDCDENGWYVIVSGYNMFQFLQFQISQPIFLIWMTMVFIDDYIDNYFI